MINPNAQPIVPLLTALNALTTAAQEVHMGSASQVDAVDFSNSTFGVTVNLSSGTGSGGFAKGDNFAEIKNLKCSAHNDVLIGNAIANILNGSDQNDILSGAGGADDLYSGKGLERLFGNA